jgi:hypothetical protein
MKIRPLLASYGGGHAQIIAMLAKELIARKHQPEIIGFTTAFRFFEREGLAAKSVTSLLDPNACNDAPYEQAVEPFLVNQTHPDISPEETRAYFTLGLRDLAEIHGLDKAIEMVEKHGRQAFRPVSVMERYLRRTQPDVVITTTSPRFEHALLQAARRVGIPSLAVSDLFLLNERTWILKEDYAEHLTVLTGSLKKELIDAGLSGTKIHVTGNPVFDTLKSKPGDDKLRLELRDKLGLSDNVVILWPSPAVLNSDLYDRELQSAANVSAAFEGLCAVDPKYKYILRPHPNAPYQLPKGADNGILDMGLLTPNQALLIADIVCAEISTMGLQAALRGTPVICVGFAKEAIYPQYGLAHTANTLDDAVNMIAKGMLKTPVKLNSEFPEVGNATRTICDLIENISQERYL